MEKLKKNSIVTALSIYASRVSACIAVMDKDTGPNIIGLGKSEGRFMGGTGVLDIDGLCRAIRDSLKMAGDEAGAESPRALISISGGAITSQVSRGMITLSQRGEEISEKNIKSVLRIADRTPASIEKEIIHSIPQDFSVDGQDGIKNPAGLYGVKLEAETLLISAHVPFLQNVVKCLNLAGTEAEDIVFSGVAASRCLLPFEGNDGTGIVLLEIDNNFTALSLFFSNVLRSVDVYSKSVIADGALEILKEKIDKMRGHKPISRIMLAGGSYFHEDFMGKVDSVFGIPSQMAHARNARGTARDISNPAHLTSLGLALYGLEKQRRGIPHRKAGAGLFHRASRRFGDFLNEYF